MPKLIKKAARLPLEQLCQTALDRGPRVASTSAVHFFFAKRSPYRLGARKELPEHRERPFFGKPASPDVRIADPGKNTFRLVLRQAVKPCQSFIDMSLPQSTNIIYQLLQNLRQKRRII